MRRTWTVLNLGKKMDSTMYMFSSRNSAEQNLMLRSRKCHFQNEHDEILNSRKWTVLNVTEQKIDSIKCYGAENEHY